MTTFLAPSMPAVLDQPTPEPRRFDLLSTITVHEPESDRWTGGAWTGGEVPGPAFTHDPFSSGSTRVKYEPGRIETQKSRPFTVYLPGFCMAQSIGPDPQPWIDKLTDVFEVYEGAAVEKALATADGHTDIGPYLCDTNLEILNAGNLAAPVIAYGLLEEAVARHGTGLLHIGLRTFASWQDHNLLFPQGDTLRTRLGTPVAVGYGYVGAVPVGQVPLGDGQEWAFASGPIEVYRSPGVEVVPPNGYAGGLDRTTNEALFIAERPYLLNWMARQSPDDADHTQAGVLVSTDASSLADLVVISANGDVHLKVGANIIDDLP